MRIPETAASSTLVGKVTNAALVLLALALLGAAVAVFSGAYQVRPVLSSSMTPQLSVGSVVITQRVPVATVRAKDVIVFHDPYDPAKLVVHRITTITREGGATTITTKGDANAVPDPWKVNLRGNDSYRVVGNIPVVGYAAVWIHQPAIAANLVPVGAGLGALALAVLFWPGRKTASEGTAPTTAAEAPAADPELGDAELGDRDDGAHPFAFGLFASAGTADDPLDVEPDTPPSKTAPRQRQPVAR